MKPVIGITIDVMDDRDSWMSRGIPDQEMLICTRPVFDVILEAGGIPLGIPVIKNISQVEAIIDKIDGLCVPSGPDIFPGFSGQRINKYSGEVKIEKDESDLAFVKKAIEKSKPIIGMCRGVQIINIALGGDLVSDISACIGTSILHNPSKVHDWLPVHPINISKDSILYQILLKEQVDVNSFHHQSLDKIGKGLKIVAQSEDGVIEAVESLEPFIMGVQFHPEYMYEKYPHFLSIFSRFVKECGK
jgi:putative glutamine amidotransferase